MHDTLLGMAIMVVATSMISVGAVLQKKAVDRLPPLESLPVKASVGALVRSPAWVVGWVLGTSAVVLNMIALGFADISVIQPINGFGLVVLAIASRLLLGETLSRRAVAGMATIIAGVALVGVVAPSSRSFASSEEILGSFGHLSAVVTLAGMTGAIVLLIVVARKTERVAGVLYALVGAACSVVGFTLAKGVFGIIHLAGVAVALSMWPSYAFAAALLVYKIAALVFQQLSFQRGKAVVVTSVFSATSVALPLLPGRLVFREPVSGLLVPAVVLIVIGVVLLSSARADSSLAGATRR